jgi:hypothetical protein
MMQPYIKPTRHVHDSGFRTFEVGYILEMTSKNTVAKKKVLGEYSDHIFQDYMMIVDKTPIFCLNMDLTMDGYIRFFAHSGELIWDSIGDFATSSMGLKFIPKKV